MNNPQIEIEAVSSQDLLARTRELARKSVAVEADLLVHLGEVDARKLYLERAFSSMFAFCVGELGFSEDAAYNRITVARASRRLHPIIDAVRSGAVHLAGLRLLVPHLTAENHRDVLAKAAGKTKREIEELVAHLAPQPPVPSLIRKLPDRVDASCAPAARTPSGGIPSASAASSITIASSPSAPLGSHRSEQQQCVRPLSEDAFKVQFTASRALRDKLQAAQDLLRHRVPDGDLAAIVEPAVDLLLEHVKRERFAAGRKPKEARTASRNLTSEPPRTQQPTPSSDTGCAPADVNGSPALAKTSSRHIPDPVKRAVYERDGGRCTFIDAQGRRCSETALIEYDHLDGFARTGEHDIDRIRLLCRGHNQYAAEKMYGRAFMEEARRTRLSASRGPGKTPSVSSSALFLPHTTPSPDQAPPVTVAVARFAAAFARPAATITAARAATSDTRRCSAVPAPSA